MFSGPLENSWVFPRFPRWYSPLGINADGLRSGFFTLSFATDPRSIRYAAVASTRTACIVDPH